MFAIAFDLDTKVTYLNYNKNNISQAYAEIRNVLNSYGFRYIQGSLYVTDNEDMSNLFLAIMSLKALPWFPASVRDIRAFRIEQWSDFTNTIKK